MSSSSTTTNIVYNTHRNSVSGARFSDDTVKPDCLSNIMKNNSVMITKEAIYAQNISADSYKK